MDEISNFRLKKLENPFTVPRDFLLEEIGEIMQNKGFFSTNNVSVLFLQKINELKERGSTNEIFKIIRECKKIEIIVTCAENDNGFKELCKAATLDKHWESIWCTYGLILPSKKTFYAHPGMCQFDLVCGIYYYHLSLLSRQNCGKNYFPKEIELSLKSKNYLCIHAIQSYQQYVLSNISENDDEATQQFEDMIEEIYQLVPYYGSYAYMMLVDVFLKYQTWCTKKK